MDTTSVSRISLMCWLLLRLTSIPSNWDRLIHDYGPNPHAWLLSSIALDNALRKMACNVQNLIQTQPLLYPTLKRDLSQMTTCCQFACCLLPESILAADVDAFAWGKSCTKPVHQKFCIRLTVKQTQANCWNRQWHTCISTLAFYQVPRWSCVVINMRMRCLSSRADVTFRSSLLDFWFSGSLEHSTSTLVSSF